MISVALDANLKTVVCNPHFLEQLSTTEEECDNVLFVDLFKPNKNLSAKHFENLHSIDLTPINNTFEIIRFNISPIFLDEFKPGFLLTGKSVKNNKDWEQSLYQILKGTYDSVGGDFFKSITQTLAKTLGMRYALIGEVKDFYSENPIVDTVTFWNNNKFETNFSFNLLGSPCENVVDREQVIVLDNVDKLFPNDQDLKALGIKSYIGTPIHYKNGSPMGLVVVMDTKPVQIDAEQAEKLNMFAKRIGAEMEWYKNDLQLIEQERKLRTILKTLPNPVYVQNNTGKYENCNDAFLSYFKIKEADIVNLEFDELPDVIKNNEILSASHNEKTRGINRIETNIICADNTIKESIVIKAPINDRNNERTGIIGVIQDISDMKDAEKNLQLNEEKYRTLFNKANDAFLLMKNDKIVDCNPKAEKVFGCSKYKIVGSTPQSFSPLRQPDDQNSAKKALQKIKDALRGKAITFYWKHKKYNGALFDAEISLNAFHINDEMYVQAIIRDVSEKYKENKDKENQTLRMKKMYELTSNTHTPFNEKTSKILKMATESLGMQLGGISVIDGKLFNLLNHYSTISFNSEDLTFLSQTYCSITVNENRLVGIPDFRISPYADTEVYNFLQLESYIGVPYWVRGELRGTIFFTAFYPMKEFKSFDSDFVQIIAQWIGSSIEREEYEDSLLKNQALLDTLLREMPVDFSVRDANLKMIWQSNKSKEVWGDNEGKDIDFSDINKESADKWKNIFSKVLDGETIRGENEVEIYGKPYSLHSIASPIKVQGKVEQITIIHIDISQLKKAEKKLQSRNSKLKKLNSELDRFVYSASHDLRAPLASLLGLIDLSSREKSTPILGEYLALMNKSITKLDSFISDITDYSRNLRLTAVVEKIDIESLVNELFSSLAFMSPDIINFSVKVIGKFNFHSDPDRLKLIINNLLSNSIRYRSKSRPLAISIEVIKEKNKATIKVIDNGIGIEKKYQSKIFNMFYRANDQNTGSGLGLFIVQETVDKLKGKIHLTSEVNKGTVFKITLPNSKG